ncbi:MAG: hypothetical protein KJ571_07125 [Bacteroidetes bacterium]|nr:hypothetical protein [Bacteroidota bacterium]
MKNEIVLEIANKFNKDPEEVQQIVTEFIKLLHKDFYECEDDFIGANLFYQLQREAYFHFMDLLELFVRDYDNWEFGHAGVYTGRLGSREDWEPYEKSMDTWQRPSWEE